MVKTIRIALDENEHERLTEAKKEKGLTWKQAVYKGLEVEEPARATEE